VRFLGQWREAAVDGHLQRLALASFCYALNQEKRFQVVNKHTGIKRRPIGGDGSLRCRWNWRKLQRPRRNFGDEMLHHHVLEIDDGEESTLLKGIEVWEYRYVVPSR
jgi:hypothetical protein